MFQLRIETDNAAFEDKSREVAHLLFEVRSQVLNGHTDGPVMDSNGNKVGAWRLT